MALAFVLVRYCRMTRLELAARTAPHYPSKCDRVECQKMPYALISYKQLATNARDRLTSMITNVLTVRCT